MLPPAQPGPIAPKRNTLALVALIIAIVGFVFACMPGALIVGWILLPIAFILSIVALTQKGKKGKAVLALILSIVGTIVGVVVFMAVVSKAANDAFGGTETSVTTDVKAPLAGTDDEKKAEEVAKADDAKSAAEAGTRDNPAPIGSTITGKEWTVVVNSHNAAANDIVAASPYNDEAPAGFHYEIVNSTVTYTGDDKGISQEVGVAMVTSAGNVVNSFDKMVFLEDSFGIDELYNGASATGSHAFLVPDGETLTVRVRPGMLADEVFVK